MTAPCRDRELALSLHAAGALEGAEAAALERHLASCAPCRAEAARAAELLGLARLPPPSAAELRALDGLAAQASAALAARRPRSPVSALRALGVGRRVAVGLLAAAAVAALVIAPVAIRRRLPGPPGGPEAAVAAQWQEPDLEALWQATEVLELEESAGGQDLAALAAYDGG